MRIIKLIGLAAITVLALAATAASASAALPEFLTVGKRCDLSATRPPNSHGPYPTEADCLAGTNRGTGDWWFLLLHFTSTSGAGQLVTKNNTISCTKDHNLGWILSNTTIEVVVTFLGCKLAPFGFECKSKNAKAEEIVTVNLKGTLGYINKAAKEVGLKLEPTEGAAEYTAGEIECLGQKVKVTGAVIGKATPINELKTEGTLAFTAAGTKQVPEEIEIGGVKEAGIKLSAKLNGGAAEEASEETTDTITFDGLVEIMA